MQFTVNCSFCFGIIRQTAACEQCESCSTGPGTLLCFIQAIYIENNLHLCKERDREPLVYNQYVLYKINFLAELN